jgi:hypothetical protein
MLSGTLRARALMAVMIFVALAHAACAPRRDPIVLEEGVLAIENQTSRDWRNVVITVNDHFRGGAASLASGARMTAPLSQLQTAYGQKYDRTRQSVFKVEVTATDADGKPVKVTWGGQRKPR